MWAECFSILVLLLLSHSWIYQCQYILVLIPYKYRTSTDPKLCALFWRPNQALNCAFLWNKQNPSFTQALWKLLLCFTELQFVRSDLHHTYSTSIRGSTLLYSASEVWPCFTELSSHYLSPFRRWQMIKGCTETFLFVLPVDIYFNLAIFSFFLSSFQENIPVRKFPQSAFPQSADYQASK